MKNKLLYSFLIVGASFCANSCSLDETPIDRLPIEEAFKNQQLIYATTVAAIYEDVGATDGWGNGLGGTDRGMYDINTFTSDEAMLPTRGSDWADGGLWTGLFEHKWTQSTDMFKGVWEYLYRVVGKSNQAIEQLKPIGEKDPSNIFIPQYIAELRAMRAMYYYYLLDNFGRVPIVTSSSTPVSEVVQSERSVVYAFVIKELQESLPYLKSANGSVPGEYYGRMTKATAYYLLAKLALNAEVYADDNWVDNNGTPNGSKAFSINGTEIGAWKATVAYCDSVKKEGYKLTADFSDNFALDNQTKGTGENIFVIPMDPTGFKSRNMFIVRSLHYAHAPAWNFEGWNGASATKDLLNIFREGSLDPRFEMSFFAGKVKGFDGSIVQSDGVDLEYTPDRIDLRLSGSLEDKQAGARWAKYELDPNTLANGQLVHNDYVVFRYADVLLMKAEALVRDGQNGDAPLKEVRDRVGASVRTATLDNILKERILELSWEGFRRQDLVRFGKYTARNEHRPATEAFRVVFPIPLAIINSNGNLTQNAGYN